MPGNEWCKVSANIGDLILNILCMDGICSPQYIERRLDQVIPLKRDANPLICRMAALSTIVPMQ